MKYLNHLKTAILLLICGPAAVCAANVAQSDSASESVQNQIQQKISPKEALTLIESNAKNQDFVILDVRTPEEFADGHIKNSVLLNFKLPTFGNELDKLDKNKTYVVYCRTGNRSGKACDLMKTKGFKKAYDVGGGIVQWKKDGLPIQK